MLTAEQFLQVTDWLPEWMLLLTCDGTVLASNRVASIQLGISAAQFPLRLQDLVESTGDGITDYLRACSRGTGPIPGSLVFRKADGGKIKCVCRGAVCQPRTATTDSLLQLQLVPNDNGRNQFQLLNDRIDELTREIHQRKHAEEAWRKLQTQIQQAQKLESLGVLAGGIAHDFNNLLTSILGYSDLARQVLPPGSQARSFLDEVVLGARRAADLTQQMLAYSGKGTFVIQPLCLKSLVTEMIRLLEVSISKKCVLKYDFADNLPAFNGDATQIRQIIMNLVINASEAIGERSGVIAVSTGAMYCDRAYLTETYLDENLPEGLYVYLEVADTGCGMSEATRAKIFDPFFTTKFTGRGLGLAAVLGIVRGHRGAIKVYSEPGRGTTFKALLPATNQPAQAERTQGPHADDWCGTGKVLVADDEESVRSLARSMLERLGFSVITATNGLQCVEAYRAAPADFCLVLLDMTMPHMDGEQTFRELRRIRSGVRVLLSSGYNEALATDRFAGKGLAGFLHKPYRYEELRTAVRKVLSDGHC